MKWVIGDVHGCYHELRKLLKKINYRTGKDELYILGDVLDKGEDI